MKLLISTLFSVLFTTAYASPIKFMAFADAPYYDDSAYSMLDKLILQTREQNPDFVVHVGDIRGGSHFDCSDETYLRVFDLFKKFSLPVVYTPGDNEWTDCHKLSTGPNDPLERLQRLRQIFFSNNKSIGKQSISMQLQSENKKHSNFTENRRWISDDILFMTLHIVGSANNRRTDSHSAMEEFDKRNRANIEWLEESFKVAEVENAKALVMFYHADLLTDESSKGLSKKKKKKLEHSKSGYTKFTKKLLEATQGFNKPILAVHGDSHRFRIDHPLMVFKKTWDKTARIAHFTRLEVYGAPNVRGVMVTVDTTKPQPLSITPMPQITWEYPPPSEDSSPSPLLKDM